MAFQKSMYKITNLVIQTWTILPKKSSTSEQSLHCLWGGGGGGADSISVSISIHSARPLCFSSEML